MPIYEYACDRCGHEFEAEQRITDDPLKSCPTCRGRKVRRLISRTSFVLKGGGWYSDLYSSPGSAAAAGSKGADAGAGGDGADAAPKSQESGAESGKGSGTSSEKPKKKKGGKAAA
jgi:putative FmdB family regulatory protein